VENMASPLLLLIILSVYPVQTHVLDDALEWTDGRKFFCSTNRVTWHDADSQCRARGMSLAVVEDRPLMVAINNHCKFCCYCDTTTSCVSRFEPAYVNYASAWVGGRKEPNSNFWKWNNHGLVIDEGDPTWWKRDDDYKEPNYLGPCLEVMFWQYLLGLNDRPCSDLRTFVCEQRP